jgi:hypothetical protein
LAAFSANKTTIVVENLSSPSHFCFDFWSPTGC